MNKTILIIALILIFYFTLNKFNLKIKSIKKPVKMTPELEKLFNEDLSKFVLRMEGGLTNDKTDTASKFPSPTPEKWHTNKGITWKTYTDSSKTLKFTPSVKEFLVMPYSRWFSIFKNNYINRSNFSDNLVLNSYMALWLWGGWARKHMSLENVNKVLNDKKLTNRQKLFNLVELRKQYFDNIIKANPPLKKYEKGWKARANEFYDLFNKYL